MLCELPGPRAGGGALALAEAVAGCGRARCLTGHLWEAAVGRPQPAVRSPAGQLPAASGARLSSQARRRDRHGPCVARSPRRSARRPG